MKIFNQDFTYEWVKDNLTMLLLVPTLLGGLWQVLELAAIGVPYIRFFSVSQMVSDGLLMLFILGIILYASITLANPVLKYWLSEHLYYPEKILEEKNVVQKKLLRQFRYKPFNKWSSYFFVLLAIIGIVMTALYPSKINNPLALYLADNKTTAGSLYLFLVWVVSGLTIIAITISSVLVIFGYQFIVTNPRKRNLKAVVAVIIIFLVFLTYRPLAIFFHRSFLASDNFKNLEYVKAKVFANNPKAKSWNFEYFNDQYIFIRINDSSSKEKIEVFEFNALFVQGR